MALHLKRVYEEASDSDGKRILVDRLWPRGISKQKARLDEWEKDIAPSPSLRKWFQHDPNRFEEFKQEYRKELDTHPEKIAAVSRVLLLSENETVTLIYGAKDSVHNHAIVLKEYLEEKES
ncbi:DUF488 domain-containing protein [Salinibacillus xinjiangensis]|uniref:DUF488 family protein n=1 Tax=Salinibacillus xinjiangensis TaxID=1229268 RepID=A0A6G1X5Q7_9BACI|nr:DUF488 domain-containing protein [Salinibacillus xinjiangensis]MRG86272.1 DUF488 family protein [Salinibacillus xinjiangensis]